MGNGLGFLCVFARGARPPILKYLLVGRIGCSADMSSSETDASSCKNIPRGEFRNATTIIQDHPLDADAGQY